MSIVNFKIKTKVGKNCMRLPQTDQLMAMLSWQTYMDYLDSKSPLTLKMFYRDFFLSTI